MRYIKNIFLLLLFAISLSPLHSQILREGEAVPQGAVIYSLPQTSVSVKVTIVKESFTPGVYAQFAQKYLGEAAQVSSKKTAIVKSVNVKQFTEADPSLTIAVNIGTSKNASANFLNFCSQGLIVSPGAFNPNDKNFRFPQGNQNRKGHEQFAPKGKKTKTVYNEVAGEDGEIQRVAQKITQEEDLTLEQRASKTADLIFSLRENKIAILTGDTDANYEGAALGDAMKEFDKMDKKLLRLFYGTTSRSKQTMSFEIVPDASKATQKYVICKISDTEGILPASAEGGKELVLVLSAEEQISGKQSAENIATSKGKIVYRKPVVVKGKILLAGKELAETRISVYQFGRIVYFPIELATGR